MYSEVRVFNVSRDKNDHPVEMCIIKKPALPLLLLIRNGLPMYALERP